MYIYIYLTYLHLYTYVFATRWTARPVLLAKGNRHGEQSTSCLPGARACTVWARGPGTYLDPRVMARQSVESPWKHVLRYESLSRPDGYRLHESTAQRLHVAVSCRYMGLKGDQIIALGALPQRVQLECHYGIRAPETHIWYGFWDRIP